MARNFRLVSISLSNPRLPALRPCGWLQTPSTATPAHGNPWEHGVSPARRVGTRQGGGRPPDTSASELCAIVRIACTPGAKNSPHSASESIRLRPFMLTKLSAILVFLFVILALHA